MYFVIDLSHVREQLKWLDEETFDVSVGYEFSRFLCRNYLLVINNRETLSPLPFSINHHFVTALYRFGGVIREFGKLNTAIDLTYNGNGIFMMSLTTHSILVSGENTEHCIRGLTFLNNIGFFNENTRYTFRDYHQFIEKRICGHVKRMAANLNTEYYLNETIFSTQRMVELIGSVLNPNDYAFLQNVSLTNRSHYMDEILNYYHAIIADIRIVAQRMKINFEQLIKVEAKNDTIKLSFTETNH